MRKALLGFSALLLMSFDVPKPGLVGSSEIGPVDPLADTDCGSVPAHFVVSVDDAGRYEMPPGLSGGPTQSGCPSAYIVDFVSPNRRLNTFKPDPDWVGGMTSTTGCVGRCKNDAGALSTWDVYRGDIHVYRCTDARDCANNDYSEYVGTMDSLDYSDVGILSAPQRCILRPHSGGGSRPIPIARDAYGVRLVVKYTVDVRADGPLGPCGQGPSVLEPPLAFTASGTAGFRVIAPLKKGLRPRAVPPP